MNADVIHLKPKLPQLRIKTLFVAVALAAIATAWGADVYRRNAPRFLHIYVLRGVDSKEPLLLRSAEIRPNTTFTFGLVPEEHLSGEFRYDFCTQPSLQFRFYHCEFSGEIRFGGFIRAEVSELILDHVFIVTSEPDAQLAINAANGG